MNGPQADRPKPKGKIKDRNMPWINLPYHARGLSMASFLPAIGQRREKTPCSKNFSFDSPEKPWYVFISLTF
jgi:hypothetical protein